MGRNPLVGHERGPSQAHEAGIRGTTGEEVACSSMFRRGGVIGIDEEIRVDRVTYEFSMARAAASLSVRCHHSDLPQ